MPDFILTQGAAFLVMEALENTPTFRAWAAMRALQPVQVAPAPAEPDPRKGYEDPAAPAPAPEAPEPPAKKGRRA